MRVVENFHSLQAARCPWEPCSNARFYKKKVHWLRSNYRLCEPSPFVRLFKNNLFWYNFSIRGRLLFVQVINDLSLSLPPSSIVKRWAFLLWTVCACCLWLSELTQSSSCFRKPQMAAALLLSPSCHSILHGPFNPIFTDLEIAFHQLWMLKETNLLTSAGPSAEGPGKAVGLQEWLTQANSFARFHWVGVYTHGSVRRAQAT